MTAPLAGVTVVVTRPRAQAAGFAARVAESGATPLLLPALDIQPVELDPGSRERLAPDAHDWTVYTSANAVAHSLSRLPRPSRTRVAAIGRGTARALEERGVAVDALPAGASESEGLLTHPALADPAGLRVLIVKGEGGRTLLRDELARRGARVATAEVYRRVPATPGAAELEALRRALARGPVAVAATSAETLAALLAAVDEERAPRLRDAVLLVPGERVAASARAQGWRGPVVPAPSAEDAAMAAALAGPAGVAALAADGAC